MASRRDQLMSYQFVIQRVVSALVMREADPAQAPFRRGAGAVFASIMVAIIATAGVGVYGLVVKGGNNTWRAGNAVILEEETGARYVYIKEQNKLHPVLNIASARLILNSPAPVLRVSRNSLVGTPRGHTLGIRNAPDTIPDPERLSQEDWTLCSEPGEDVSGSPTNNTVLFVGARPPEGKLLGDEALLVEDQKNKEKFLIWHEHRYQLKEPDKMLTALGLGSHSPLQVGRAWLNGLPAGDDIKPISVPNAGAASPFPDARVGQVLMAQTQGGSRNYYLVLSDGITQITEFQSELILGDSTIVDKAYPAGTGRPRAVEISTAEANTAKKSKTRLLPSKDDANKTAPPEATPDLVQTDNKSTACAAFSDGEEVPEVMVNAKLPSGQAPNTPKQTEEGAPLADRVVVKPGWGAVVMARQGGADGGGQLYLITDQGVSYAVPNLETMLVILGPEGAKAHAEERFKPVHLPASLVARIPQGPGLNKDAAHTAVTL